MNTKELLLGTTLEFYTKFPKCFLSSICDLGGKAVRFPTTFIASEWSFILSAPTASSLKLPDVGMKLQCQLS